MTPTAKEQLLWLHKSATYKGDECLIWPFSRLKGGYGRIARINGGDQDLAHRWMCEKIKGKPPTEKHEAAHSCGRGRHGCTTPKHLSWKTPTENHLDKRNHGTSWIGANKLTPVEVREIRKIGKSKKQRDIAMIFGVSQSNISMILNQKTWTVSIGVDPR